MEFIQARWYTPSDHRVIDWLVLHTAETNELSGTARAVAHYFAETDRKASAHYIADQAEIVQSVHDKDVAYGAPSANRRGLHFEHAGRAAQTAEDWKDPYSEQMLALSAALVAKKCQEYGIPAVKLGPSELKAGQKGICGHADCTKAFGGSHTDPGSSFPWDRYISMVRSHLQPAITSSNIETGLAAMRILYGISLPPATRQKLDVLRADPFWPPQS